MVNSNVGSLVEVLQITGLKPDKNWLEDYSFVLQVISEIQADKAKFDANSSKRFG